MNRWMALPALALGLTLTATPGFAQDQTQRSKPIEEPAKPSEGPTTDGNASPSTGGDTRPSAVDPAQSTKTGANTGEGASYNRSTEKGQSTLPKDDADGKMK